MPHPDTKPQPNEPHPDTKPPSRFATPKTREEIAKSRMESVPKRTRQDTEYCVRLWHTWSKYRCATTEESVPPLLEMDAQALQFWMINFILEVRSQKCDEYPPNTLYHLVCGIMRFLRVNGKPNIDFFKDVEFADFRTSLDAEMKRLQAKGKGSGKKQAEPLTTEEEEMLWNRKILGDHNPQALLHTVFYMIGLYFALRSGDEHRQLRHHPCQIQLVEKPGERSYLKYTEDISKNRPGGLKGRKYQPKTVIHHENVDNPDRCFVQIFKKYSGLCPSDRPDGAFYLTPLKIPKEDCWFSCVPIGRNKLSTMCKLAGIGGFKTNHSLRATAATRLYSSGVDEQLVMERTRHRSIEGICSYKRISGEQQETVSDILSNCKKTCTDLQPLHSALQSQPQPQPQSLSSSTANMNIPTHISTAKAQHAGSFCFSGCTNININFK